MHEIVYGSGPSWRHWLGSLIAIFLTSHSVLSNAQSQVHDSKSGITLSLDQQGKYSVIDDKMKWVFAGKVPGPIQHIRKQAGKVGQDAYSEILFSAADSEYSMRLFPAKKSVLFRRTVKGVEAGKVRFPEFSDYPKSERKISFDHAQFSPMLFDRLVDAPWAFVDHSFQTFVISPANHFMVSNNFMAIGQLSVGIEPAVTEPLNGDVQAVLTLSDSINGAFENWGEMLTLLNGKSRPTDDAGLMLSHLGYWTDNTAAYYYNFVQSLGYAGTLRAVRDEFQTAQVPLGYVQLDSWWYLKSVKGKPNPPQLPPWSKADKDNYGGTYLYEMPSDVVQGGLNEMQRDLKLPLVVHARWFDKDSPYRNLYKFSGDVPIDPAYWQKTMSTLKAANVSVYEQDWLDEMALPRLDRLNDGDAFMDEMAAAALKNGIHLQYCMPLPRHFLQSTKYSNALTIRPSPDGFDRKNWNEFLFGSRLARAVGLWPWVDAFFSRDSKNLLVAALSGGPVGVGDRIQNPQGPDTKPDWCGKEMPCDSLHSDNLRRAVMDNGILVKPDEGLLPLDQSYLKPDEMVAAAYSRTTGSTRTNAAYVFAYKNSATDDKPLGFAAQELGLHGDVLVFDYFSHHGSILKRGDRFTFPGIQDGSYFVVTPLAENRPTILGDLNYFVPLAKQHVVLENRGRSFRIRLSEKDSEGQIWFWSKSRPKLKLVNGTVKSEELEPSSDSLWKVTLERKADRDITGNI